MAFKQGNNPLSRKASPMRMSPFKKQEPSMSMDELQKMAAAQDAASKKQALELPQIEYPGSDYEMDQDMAYPGGERGRDYDEEGTNAPGRYSKKEKGMSRHTSEHSTEEYMERKDAAIKKSKGVSRKVSPLNGEFSDAVKDKSLLEEEPATAESASQAVSDFGDNLKKQEKKPGNSKAEIKARKSQDKADPKISKAQMRANKAKSKSEAAKETAEKGVSAESNQRNRAKAKRLAKKADRIEGREKRKAIRKKSKKDIKKTR